MKWFFVVIFGNLILACDTALMTDGPLGGIIGGLLGVIEDITNVLVDVPEEITDQLISSECDNDRSYDNSQELANETLTCDACGLLLNESQKCQFYALLDQLEVGLNASDRNQLDALRKLYGVYAESAENKTKLFNLASEQNEESKQLCTAKITELLPTILKNQWCPYNLSVAERHESLFSLELLDLKGSQESQEFIDPSENLLPALRTIHDQILTGRLSISQCNDCIDVAEVPCEQLSQNGSCLSDPEFMMLFCKYSCQFCDCKHNITTYSCPSGFMLQKGDDADDVPVCHDNNCTQNNDIISQIALEIFNFNQNCNQPPSSTVHEPPRGPAAGFWTVHDPSILKTCEGEYIVYSTKSYINEVTCPGGGTAPASISYDQHTFYPTGDGFPGGLPSVNPWTNNCPSIIWGPDTQLVNGTYYMYYSASHFGSKDSVIGVAVSSSGRPGTWQDLGHVLDSNSNDFNAIDPNLLPDTDGRWYLTFGSFYSGIWQIEIDPATARPKAGAGYVHLATRNIFPPWNNAIEGPFVFKKNGFYYLFVAFDYCCKGVNSNYRIMVGRATSPSGPYVDRNGVPMLNGGGTQLLGSNGPIIGPGGVSVYADVCHDIIVYHYYDGLNNGAPHLAINYLGFTPDGWPYIY